MASITDWVKRKVNEFDWFKSKEVVTNPTKESPRRPQSVDWTDSLQINLALTKGLYHNSYPGMKLGGSMCYTPIAVPLWLMGIPVPISQKDNEQEILKEIVLQKQTAMRQIHLQCHRDGTCWIYPHYSTSLNMVVWEFISDDTISDIIRDLDTREIIKIITDEEITISIAYNKTSAVRRQRIFTKGSVEIKWISGDIPSNLRDKKQRNVLKILPIPFSNNRDGSEIRGHSDYERIITDIKNYHDIDLKRSAMLAKFDPKMVQEVLDVDQWLENNGWASITDIDIPAIDLIINKIDQEKTTFAFPERAYQAYEVALKNIFRKIVEGSGIPEILWGTKVTGNKASADQQMDTVVKLVEDKREQKDDPYTILFTGTLQLELLARMQIAGIEDIDIDIIWNKLDAINEETKSVIFKNYSQGISFLINSAGATKKQLFKIWDKLYPEMTEDEFQEFRVGISEMAKHKSFQNTPYETIADISGEINLD